MYSKRKGKKKGTKLGLIDPSKAIQCM